MVLERIGRDIEDVVLQFLQCRYAIHLLFGLGVTEDEVAKAHVLFNEAAQVDIHLLRVLIDEVEVLGLCLFLVDNLRTLQNQWHIFVTTSYFTQQFQTSLRIALLDMRQASFVGLHGETGIADDTQHIVVIALIPLHSLLVVRGQHHLGSSAFTLGSSVGVQCLSREVLRLCQDIVVEVRQHAGIEADVILHQQNHLHTSLRHVVLNVHLILNQLDDGQDKIGITQPAEHVVECRHVLVLDALRDTMRERCQYHAGNLRSHLLDVASYGKGVVIRITRHTYHQVDVRCLQHAAGLFGRRHLCKRGWVAHTQLHVFIEYLLVHASVVLQHEGIVGVGHYQHIENASRHQVDKRHIFQEEIIEFLRNRSVAHYYFCIIWLQNYE